MLDKNIIIMGSARCGKTTLARELAKNLGFSIISLDDIISGLKAYPSLGITHDVGDEKVSANFAPFLLAYLKELIDGSNYYNGIKFVIEGTHIDFDLIMPYLNENKDKYEIIGLVYNDLTTNELFNNIRKYDTEDDWTYYSSDEVLKGDASYFIDRNKYFYDNFIKYDIRYYDTSKDREKVINDIVNKRKDRKI